MKIQPGPELVFQVVTVRDGDEVGKVAKQRNPYRTGAGLCGVLDPNMLASNRRWGQLLHSAF